MSDFTSFLSSINFYDLVNTLKSSNYYNILFPFLLVFALMSTILPKIKIFQSKKDGKPLKSVIFVISFIISYFSVTLEISDGWTIGKLISLLFPNISTLTIAILSFYIIGSLFNKNFFRDFFNRKQSAFIYFFFGVVALGSVIYYVGLSMGFWSTNPFDTTHYWNTIFVVGFIIMGVVFIFLGITSFGLILLLVTGIYLYNGGQGFILSYFLDPVIFILIIVILLSSWVTNDGGSEKEKLEREIEEAKTKDWYKYLKSGKIPPAGDNRIFDIAYTTYKNRVDRWNRKYPNEKKDL